MICGIAICDDEKAEAEYLRVLVDKWSAANKYNAAITTFESAEAFLFDYAGNKNYDIILLDIEMGKINGVELAKIIRKDNESVQIVFITGFPDFIAQGYEVSALNYLIKPVAEKKLSGVLDKAYKNLGKKERAVLFDINGESVRIPAGNIISAEAFAHSVEVTTTAEKFEIRQTTVETENLLGDGFIRCHRSYIVGLKYIKRITKTDVILDNGIVIPLSRRLYDGVNRAFIKYYKGE